MSQYFAVLTNMRSVGVMGDGRTYDYTLALRSVTTTDFMTADWTRIPYEVLDRVSVRIVNEVPHINRIVYDITSKPRQPLSGNDRIFMTAAAGGLAAICRCFACFDWTVCRSGLAFSRPPYYNTASEV